MTDWADEIARHLFWHGSETSIAINLRAARNDALEEAANAVKRYTENQCLNSGGPYQLWNTTASEKHEAVIRALKDKS